MFAVLNERTEEVQSIQENLTDLEVEQLAALHRIYKTFFTPSMLFLMVETIFIIGFLVGTTWMYRGSGTLGPWWMPGRFSGATLWKVNEQVDAGYVQRGYVSYILSERLAYWLQELIWDGSWDLIPT